MQAREDKQSTLGPVLGEVDPKELFRIVLRRKWLFVNVCVLFVAIAAVVAFAMPPKYTASSAILVESREPTVISFDENRKPLPVADTETILSEIEVVRSKAVIDRLIDKLDLMNHPAFNPQIQTELHWSESLKKEFDLWLAETLGEEPAAPEPLERVDVVQQVLGNLNVSQRGLSRVISISYTARTAETAALIANSVAELYIDEQLETQFREIKRTSDWMQRHITDLQQKVQESEGAIEEFRAESGLVEANGETLIGQQLTELNTQLVQARTKHSAANARMEEVNKLIEEEGGLDAIASAMGSKVLETLRLEESKLERRIAELSVDYGERHPTLINARAELEDLNGEIDSEVGKIIRGLENEMRIARAQEAALKASIGELQEMMEAANHKRIELRALERELNANRLLLENFMTRAKQANAQDDQQSQRPNARVISDAVVPEFPASPKKKLILAGGGAVGFAIALFLVFLLDYLHRDALRTGAEVEEATGLPVFSMVPGISGSSSGVNPVARYIENYDMSFADAIRNLQTRLLFAGRQRPCTRLLVTSTDTGEGKTTIATCTAIAFARSGRKTLLLEADLRKPTIRSVIEMSDGPGLSNYLRGECGTSDMIYKFDGTGPDIIPAGNETVESQWLLSSDKMSDLLDQLGDRYDVIVVDAPPVMPVSDAGLLGRLCGQALFVVRWDKTPRRAVQTALKELREFGTQVLGTALNGINVNTYKHYGFDYSRYYARSGKKTARSARRAYS